MAKTIIIDSRKALDEAITLMTGYWEKYHYGRIDLRFGPRRSIDTNGMFFEQFKRIGDQLYGGDIEHARAECKLNIAVPILRDSSEDFRKMYDQVLAGHDYGTQLKMMRYLPVTREMSPQDARECVKQIFDVYAEKGVNWQGLDEDKRKQA